MRIDTPTPALIEDALRTAFLAGAALRKEDAQKAVELRALLAELARLASRKPKDPFALVDAGAGKSALGVLAAHLLLRARGGPFRVVAIERDAALLARAADGAARLGVADHVERKHGDVGDRVLWPHAPDVVVALHACGAASDAVIDVAAAVQARAVLLVPCCYAGGPRHGPRAESAEPPRAASLIPGDGVVEAWRARIPLPAHGLVGRRFAQSLIDAERTLRLEANGYETEVVELFAPSVSPYNLLWRARRVNEPVRTARARAQLDALVCG